MEPNSGQKSRFMIILVNMFILAPEGQTHGETRKTIRLLFKQNHMGTGKTAQRPKSRRKGQGLPWPNSQTVAGLYHMNQKVAKTPAEVPGKPLGNLGQCTGVPKFTVNSLAGSLLKPNVTIYLYYQLKPPLPSTAARHSGADPAGAGGPFTPITAKTETLPAWLLALGSQKNQDVKTIQ